MRFFLYYIICIYIITIYSGLSSKPHHPPFPLAPSHTTQHNSTRRSDATFLFKKVLTQGALAALDAKGGGAGGGKKKGAPVVSAAAMASVVVRV